MKKLIQGIVEFREGLTTDSRNLFAKLALGQKPDALFIGCSDSRVVPNLFASTNPGDLFVVRNIGNFVPPASASNTDNSVAAALEFSLFTLCVSDIVVCGHSECGAMQAIAQNGDLSLYPRFASWLKYGKEAFDRLQKGFTCDPSLLLHNQLSQVNVLQQMQHLLSYSFVQERIEKKLLRIHGWWFDIAQADVYSYEQNLNQFVLIDEKEARLILQRLG